MTFHRPRPNELPRTRALPTHIFKLEMRRIRAQCCEFAGSANSRNPRDFKIKRIRARSCDFARGREFARPPSREIATPSANSRGLANSRAREIARPCANSLDPREFARPRANSQHLQFTNGGVIKVAREKLPMQCKDAGGARSELRCSLFNRVMLWLSCERLIHTFFTK